MKTYDMMGLTGIHSSASTSHLNDHTVDKATKAKMTLESYYSNLIDQQHDRQNR